MGKKAKSNAAPAKERQVQAPPSVELLEDIVIRFILNAPDEEKATWQRLLFLVEQAHWFYEDYYAANNPESLLSYNLRDFVALVFTSVTLLQPYTAFLDPIYKTFVGYKQSVPVCGCIILNSTLTHVLLVKGWKSQSPWGFPKGKINRNEEPSACAAREVWEETGFDVTPYIEEESSLEFTFRQKNEQLFIITGIDERTAMFQPQANKEISAIEWYPVASLPDAGAAGEKDSAHSFGAMKSTGKDGSKFYMVWPFVKRLRKWIKQRKRGGGSGGVASGKEEEEEEEEEERSQQQQQHDLLPSGLFGDVVSAQPTDPQSAAEMLRGFRLDVNAVMSVFDRAIASKPLKLARQGARRRKQ